MARRSQKPQRRRPAGVPPDARFNPDEEQWEHGAKAKGKNVGPWTWWRTDGSRACATTFDDDGRLHGEFARFHPDGTVSRVGTFSHGQHAGRESFYRSKRASAEHFPAEARSVARIVLDHEVEEEQLRYYDQRGRETTAFGVPLSDWRDDRLFVGARPNAYLRGGLEAYMRTYHGLPKRLPRVAALEEFEEVWGRPPPEDLALLVRMTAAAKEPRLYELIAGFGSPRLPPRSKNLFEALILEDQKSYGGLSLVQPLAGVVAVGAASNGDTWHFGLFDNLHSDARGEGQIYLYSHEEHSLCDPITPDASTFAYLLAVCDARARGVVSPRAFARAYGRLKRKVAATPHFAELEARAVPDAGEAFRYKSQAILPRFLFFRALWLNYLFRNSGTVTVDDMPRVFVDSANEPVTEQSWKGWLARAPLEVPTAAYILFRCYFFDDEARLAEMVAACEKSPSRLVRDAAKLASELQDGRKSLGTIRNLKKLKADFLALDLDPNRREQREREKDGGGRSAQTRAKASRVAAVRAIDAGVGLEDLAWEKLDDASAHEEVLRAMRGEEEMKETLAIVDYIDGDGHAHDNLILEHEREEALLALAELGSSRIVPILVGRARRGDRKAVEMLAALKDPRAVPHLLALLDGKADRYHHFDTAVVHALRTHGARGAVPKLLAILARNPLVDWKTGIERGDLVQELVLALGSLGDRSAAPALLKVLAQTNKEYDEVHPLAAGALGALGALEAATALAQRLDRTGEASSAEEIWAYGEISAREPEAHDGARARIARLSGLDPAAEVVKAAALAKLGGERAPFVEALAHALREPGNRKVDTSRQRIWAWRCYGELGGTSPDVLTVRQFLTTDDHGVRIAATKALARQCVEAPDARLYFSFGLDARERMGGLGALHEAVGDPWGVFRYNAALRVAKIGDPASVPVLVLATRALFDEPVTSTYEFDDPPYHLRWFARALGTFTSPEATSCLIEGLASRNHHVRQVIASDPPKDERVIAALVRLLDDPRPLLRSRAQHALEAFKKSPAYARAMEERDFHVEA
jgi:hypothetical protein